MMVDLVASPWFISFIAVMVTILYVSDFIGGWVSLRFPFKSQQISKLMSDRSIASGMSRPDGTRKVVLVTGANAGIGSRTAAKLAGTGATVVLACRSVEKAEAFRASQTADKTNNMVVLKLDLASITSIRDFVVAFKAKFTKLDVLILNGGIAKTFTENGGFALTEEGFEQMMGVNFLGHFLLTGLLLPTLRNTPDARVVGQTSVAMANSYACGLDYESWTTRRPDFQDWKQYGQSKLAIRLFIEELQRREPSLLCVACHPGVVADTTLMHQSGGILELAYSWVLFKFLAMGPESSHLNTVFLASAPRTKLEGGACYGPLGRKLQWMSHPLQRLGALQAPWAGVQCSHPDMWDRAVQLLNEKGAARNSGKPLLASGRMPN